MSMMLHCKTDNLVDAKLDIVRLHVGFRLADVVRWTRKTTFMP